VLVEDEERVTAHGLEVAVVRRLFLPAVHRTLRAVDIQDQTPREPLIVPLLCEDFCFEPVEGRGERDARLPPLARGQHPRRRVFGQPLGVVGVLVARQAAIDGLAK
jgi:hypothetical protein